MPADAAEAIEKLGVLCQGPWQFSGGAKSVRPRTCGEFG